MELLGENGVILNPDKLQFSQRRLSECVLVPPLCNSKLSYPKINNQHPSMVQPSKSSFSLCPAVQYDWTKFLYLKVKFYWDDSLTNHITIILYVVRVFQCV